MKKRGKPRKVSVGKDDPCLVALKRADGDAEPLGELTLSEPSLLANLRDASTDDGGGIVMVLVVQSDWHRRKTLRCGGA